MPLPHAMACPALPLLATVAATIGAGYGKVPAIGVLLPVLAATGLAFALNMPAAYRCPGSWDVGFAMPRLFTPEEPRTLRRMPPLCPMRRRVQRDGREECLAPDRDGGAFAGCGRGTGRR